MVEFARHFTAIIRWSIVALLALIMVGNVILFILSVIQANSPNAGESFRSDTVEHWGFNKLNTTCSDVPRPLRYMRESLKGEAKRYEYCSWESKYTYWRSVSLIILLIAAAILMGILSKRSPANDSAAIWQDPKNVLRALLLPSGACGINMFLLMCFDASKITQSSSWCSDLAASSADKDPITCDYTPFSLTAGLDTILFVLWGVTTFLIFVRQMKRFRPYQQFEDEDSHEMLERGSSGYRAKGGKSWLTKHFKKAKDRMKVRR